MAQTVGEIIDRTLNTWLLGTFSAQFNTLSADIDGTATEFQCGLPLGEVTTGGFVAIDDELIYVHSRDTTNNRFVGVRGVRGTVASAHQTGAPIDINPRFPRFMVRNTMTEEIASWPETLYAPRQFSASVAANGGTIAVPATIDGFATRQPVQVRRASLSMTDSRYRRTEGYQTMVIDGVQTIMLECASGLNTTFQVTCACDFNAEAIDDFGDDTDLLQDVGLTKSMCEVLELGAAWRLLIGRASVRLFPEAEGQSRAATEVGATDIGRLAQSLDVLHDRAVGREVSRLFRQFGFGGG